MENCTTNFINKQLMHRNFLSTSLIFDNFTKTSLTVAVGIVGSIPSSNFYAEIRDTKFCVFFYLYCKFVCPENFENTNDFFRVRKFRFSPRNPY